MRIRELEAADIDSLYELHRDPESRWIAGFGSKNFDDKEAFLLRMSKISKDNESIYRVIEHEQKIVGNVGKWVHEQRPELMYEIARPFRGIGLATAAVAEFLLLFTERPLYAHTTADNLASQAVLSKFGFTKYEEVLAFSEIRNMEILEVGFLLK